MIINNICNSFFLTFYTTILFFLFFPIEKIANNRGFRYTFFCPKSFKLSRFASWVLVCNFICSYSIDLPAKIYRLKISQAVSEFEAFGTSLLSRDRPIFYHFLRYIIASKSVSQLDNPLIEPVH